MRLVCPNCRTEYEVADAAIPPKGRDVQCGACNQSWFQPGVASPRATTTDLGDDVPSAPAPHEPADKETAISEVSKAVRDAADDFSDRAPDASPPISAGADPVADTDPDRAAKRGAVLGAVSALGAGATAAAAPTGTLADRLRARRAQATPLDDDLPERQILGASSEAIDRASMQDLEMEDHLEAERLASSLSPRESAADAAMEAAMARREAQTRKSRGFQTGFAYALMAFALALVVYIAAPALSRTVPTLAPMLESYTGTIDDMRGRVQDLF